MNLDSFDRSIESWMYRHGVVLFRISLASVFIWFGLPKPLGVSPAARLIENTSSVTPSRLGGLLRQYLKVVQRGPVDGPIVAMAAD